LKNYKASKSKIMRQIRQNRYHLILIKNDLIDNPNPKIQILLNNTNEILQKYGQRNTL
jgi:hypothetical protein